MKKPKRRKATSVITFFAGLLIVISVALVAFTWYGKTMMKKVPELTFDEALSYTLADNRNAVLTVGIIQDGQASYTVYGNDGVILPPELHSYEIGSLTKTFTAAMVAKAIQDGHVKGDDTIDQYLTLPENNTYPTISQLLTHTSGYKSHYFEWPMAPNFFLRDNDFFGITKAMVLKRLSSLSTSNKDHAYTYSNFAYAALALVLEAVHGTDYASLLDAFVRDELHLKRTHLPSLSSDKDTYWEWMPGDAYLPAGGMRSDVEDMLAYAHVQLDGKDYIGIGHELLMHIDATTQQYELLGIHLDSIASAWIWDEENGMFWHNGATTHYNSYMAFDSANQTAVVILSNLSPRSRLPATVLGVKLMQALRQY